jgi:predicted NBD/HSP70 family sugar kinase
LHIDNYSFILYIVTVELKYCHSQCCFSCSITKGSKELGKMDYMTSDRTVGNVQLMQRINRLKVINIVRQNGQISRPEIIKKTGLSPSTITNIISYFIEKDLVREIGSVDSKEVGRKAVIIQFNTEAYEIIAIDVNIDRIIISLTDLTGEIKKMREVPLDPLLQEVEILRLLRHEIQITLDHQAENINGQISKKIGGIGIAISGIVKNSDRVVLSSNLKWKGLSLREYFKSIFDLEVYVENSSKTKALYELKKGNNTNEKNIIFLDLTMGVGIVSIFENKINEAVIGEFGHTTVKKDGPLCFCGNRGCLELLCSVESIVNAASSMVKQGKCSILQKLLNKKKDNISYELILEALSQGDTDVIDIIKENGEYLGIGIANLINIFNPQKIIVNGDLLLQSDLLYQTALEVAATRAYEEFYNDLKIEKVNVSIENAIKGITLNVVDRLFDLPNINNY